MPLTRLIRAIFLSCTLLSLTLMSACSTSRTPQVRLIQTPVTIPVRDGLRTCDQVERPSETDLPPLPVDDAARAAVWIERNYWMRVFLEMRASTNVACALRDEALALVDANNAAAH